jgi:hypothetical protein
VVGEETWDVGDGVGTGYETSKSLWSAANMIRLISCSTLFLVRGKYFRKLLAMKVPNFRHSSSSAEAAANADVVNMVNALITVLFTRE